MRLLIIRDGANGDVLVTTPLVRYLRETNPDATIIYGVSASCMDVVKDNPDISRLYTLESLKRKTVQEIDVVYDLRDSIQALPGNISAKVVVRAFDNPLLRNENCSRRDRARCGKTFARLYCDLANVPEDRVLENVFVIKKQGNVKVPAKFIAVSLDSCWQTKAIPIHVAQQIVDRLETFLPVVFLGRSGDYRKIRATQNLVGRTSHADLADVVRRASLFVGIDSFPLHLADTFKVPSVSIWSSTGPANTILTDGRNDCPIEYAGKCKQCYREKCGQITCQPSVDSIVDAVGKRLSRFSDPKTWVVVPNYNLGHLTYDLMESMTKTEGLRTVVLVDDGSERTTACLLDMLAEKHGAQIIHKKNGGFVSACNAGIEYALAHGNEHDTLLLLNNDVIVNRRGWLNALVSESERQHVVGQQGSRLKDDFTHGGYTNSSENCDYIDGWCLFAPLRYFKHDSVGLLDSNISTFSEDADWCLRARRLGIKMRVVPNAGLTHLHHQTFKGQKDAHVPSLHYMRKKWGTVARALSHDTAIHAAI